VSVPTRRTRATALAAVAAVVPLIAAATPSTAGAAPLRTATTTTYTHATFLQHALGLPASDTSPVIESVTYDRLEWLLRQPGKFAILIGDPATDPTFKARAQDVELAAKAAGAKKVYWFDPNLSGNAQVGSVTEPNLDIRTPDGPSTLNPTSKGIYKNAWLSLVGRYFGNGVTAVQKDGTLGSESSVVTATTGTTTVNDYGATVGASTKVGNAATGGALYDYKSAVPSTALDSFFLVYDKDRTVDGQPSKIVAWTDLTAQTTTLDTQADVTTAIGKAGAANITQIDQFAWWKDEVNFRGKTQAPAESSGGNVPILTDADNKADDSGWKVDQITYPELVDLLKTDTDKTAAILFGGTWCPNTRPVLPAINREAQKNDVTVFNFDTVLDGGAVGGATTSGANPLQSRNSTALAGGLVSNPTSLYGDLVSTYLNNLKTEYKVTSSSVVTYYAGGDVTKDASKINKLQVPYLIGYQGKPSGDGVNRQWIVDKGDGTYTEYMSSWAFTNPQPNQLGTTRIPLGAAIWTKINAQLAGFTWKTDPATVIPNTAIDTDDADFLADGDLAKITYTGTPPTAVSAASNAAGTVAVNPAALSSALSALGASAPANVADAKAALLAAKSAASPDATLVTNLETVFSAWSVAQSRKTTLIGIWGNATNPGSVAGGLAAVHAVETFFGGLPGGVVSTQSVTADSVDSATAAKVTIAITNDFGRVPTGAVSLAVKQGGTTVATGSAAVANGSASFTLPVLAAGTYDLSLSYAGDDQIAAFTKTASLTVTAAPAPKAEEAKPAAVAATKPQATNTALVKVKAGKFASAVSKAPTHSKAGKYKVKVGAASGRAATTGTVTIKLKKGSVTKTVKGKLVNGVVIVAVPKLAKGTWKVTLSYAGDANYLAASATGVAIKVKK
jgi:hypothetical protein